MEQKPVCTSSTEISKWWACAGRSAYGMGPLSGKTILLNFHDTSTDAHDRTP